ncbi:hypothetical protein [Carboxylicivirga marina]|uniref:Lipoprotein n=1 Tax=Carboxylicivirga marina TaxID=2800988 RepID=A0ABS1HG29_9BACT|nr:hypothetical protein [Carboxylicivirga marina]MBK3516625.1 hypothetical protein [Carboxylicivirga marina]
MKKVLLSLAVAAALVSCDKNDNIIDEMPMADVDLKSTTESVVTTEASLDDVAEAAEYEVDLFTGTDEAVEQIAAEQAGTTLKAGGDGEQNQTRYRNRYKWGKCPDIHIVKEEGGWPRTITLNYGESTELENGRVIAGIIEIYQTAPRRDNGVRTVTYDEFSVDGVAIVGTSVKTFKSESLSVNIVRDLTFTLPEDGTTIDRVSERNRIWTQGMETPLDHTDDIFEITGFVQCQDSDNNVYRRDITSPLIKKGGCRWIVAGEVSLSKNGVEFATINYGDMECDRVATMTTEEGSKEFNIGERKRERRQKEEDTNA